MNRPFKLVSTIIGCVLALLTSLTGLRYLAPSHPYLMDFQVAAVFRHRIWFPAHIAAGIVTLSLGPLQFSSRLRATRPTIHRTIGYVYVVAVLVGGIAGLRLSPDTPTLLADGLTEDAHSKVVYGFHPDKWGITPGSIYGTSQFASVTYSFGSLALAWLLTTAMALRHALRRDFARHQAWMIRSYSLTFAAVTVRLVVPLCFAITKEMGAAMNVAFASWTLNLLVAEWLIRRGRAKPAAFAAHA